ncbi:hypothetical protein D1831_11120 [Lactiplantibacillus garii]|uniref:D-alanyl-D-alanine carboxypeptidase n=1 Tax=Lactiplantibacillus garii TaxID=2306423 RepID=A0A3R8J5Q1_9LACO|nr:hypothetical protein [Lactiplantibacillus garii]RRK09749.1 hypothetical protein D1831_11120 [Lactiplantibacillus garii]
MKFKQRVMLGVTLLGSAALIGMGSQPNNAAAASKHRGKAVSKTYRSKATKVSHKAYYSLSKKGVTYKLSGSLKKPVLKANHALKKYTKTTWVRSKKMTVTKKGHKVRYYYVKNAKTGAAGWTKVTNLKAGKNGQATTPKKTKAKVYYRSTTKVGKLYQLKGKNSYVYFQKGKKLAKNKKYTKTRQKVHLLLRQTGWD